MQNRNLPKISIITPTLNSQRTLELCLLSVASQKYKGQVEIVVADGGSNDETINIAKKFGAKIVKNSLKTGEAGKAVGIRHATGEILAFIDSDNILPENNWLEKMIEPFVKEREIIATEPLYFTYRREDHWLTRYFALLGMGDPLSLFIGYYDRYSFISNKWTGLDIEFKNKKNYLILTLENVELTVGANGFLIKSDEIKKYPIKDYLFDIDVLKFLAQEKPIKMAKVKVGIIHLFSGNVTTFIRKQRRRVKDFLYFEGSGMRAQEIYNKRIIFGVVKFVLASVIVVPILLQALEGYSRKRDSVWLFHPLACWLTLWTYGSETIRNIFVKQQQFDRKKWSQ